MLLVTVSLQFMLISSKDKSLLQNIENYISTANCIIFNNVYSFVRKNRTLNSLRYVKCEYRKESSKKHEQTNK